MTSALSVVGDRRSNINIIKSVNLWPFLEFYYIIISRIKIYCYFSLPSPPPPTAFGQVKRGRDKKTIARYSNKYIYIFIRSPIYICIYIYGDLWVGWVVGWRVGRGQSCLPGIAPGGHTRSLIVRKWIIFN